MGHNIVEKIIGAHLASGEMRAGDEISINIDQTLTQDALGTMAYLQFESLGVDRVQTKLSVSYVDHLTLQQGFENADDHKYLQTVANRYGIIFSKPGNGICHQLHLERWTRPGWTLLGSDSHTPTAGAAGMLAIGAGGLDVARAMGGGAFYLNYPKIIRVNLFGKPQPWVTAKDIILEVLKKMTAKGNVGAILEYSGEAIPELSIPERATIANMGAEMGVISSVFPSDEVTRQFFRAQGREADWVELQPDAGALYDQTLALDLAAIEPNVAVPHAPDNVFKLREIEKKRVDQVLIGSCTNSSFADLMKVAAMLRGRKIHPAVGFGVAPGTRQVLHMIAENGALKDIVDSGARILESACGFCVGYGQSPHSGAVSVRTSNRNFQGRSGTKDAMVYLVSPESAVAAALTGEITDPRDLGIACPAVVRPEHFPVDDSMFIQPALSGDVFRGPNMGEPPQNDRIPDNFTTRVIIKLGDQVSTDHIMPAGSASRYRSNIQKSSDFLFQNVDPDFAGKCRAATEQGVAGAIVAGQSYGQGSSREHAAICPMYLGVRIVVALSIERIHATNLVNFGILPMIFVDLHDYRDIEEGDELHLGDVRSLIRQNELFLVNSTRNKRIHVKHNLTPRQIDIVLAGGLANY